MSVTPVVEAIVITPEESGPLRRVTSVEAVAGRGLVGDRYFAREDAVDPDDNITLIEAEAIEAVAAEHGIALSVEQLRRNVVTRGVALNDLVGATFKLGPVTVKALELCEPCKHLESLTQDGVLEAFVHRGGLRGVVVEGGVISVGDGVVVTP